MSPEFSSNVLESRVQLHWHKRESRNTVRALINQIALLINYTNKRIHFCSSLCVHSINTHCSFLLSKITCMLGLICKPPWPKQANSSLLLFCQKLTFIKPHSPKLVFNTTPSHDHYAEEQNKLSAPEEQLKDVSLKVNKVSLILGQGEVSSLLFQQLFSGG